ncbi:MAG: hypothetical protein NZM38_07670 [Cytophagales bacterium]|nr:hypothetical protein [Cytophagales bacterium]MDW8384634.1 hypothetical protein [Flammeovirgaceae bacterium]
MKFIKKHFKYCVSNLLSLFVVASMSGVHAQKPLKLIRTRIHPNISIVIPEGFSRMEEAAVKGTFLSYRAPIAAYQYGTSPIYITINDSESRMFFDASQMDIIQKIYKSNIQNMYQETNFLREDTVSICGRKAIQFEFIGRFVREDDISSFEKEKIVYNYINYVKFGSRLFIFGFSCPASQQEKWQPVAQNFMNNILIQESKKRKKKKNTSNSTPEMSKQ